MIIFKNNMKKGDLLWLQALVFDTSFEDEWFDNLYIQKMIKDIDGSTFISDSIFKSDVLGIISAKDLSSGVKGLMLIFYENENYVFRSNYFGDNCSKYILEMSKSKDIIISLEHLLDFENFVEEDGYELCFINEDGSKKIIKSRRDYIMFLIDTRFYDNRS